MDFFALFEGIGGFRLGLERAGFHCVGSCEIDKDARKIYAKNFGQESEFGDITKVDARDIPDHDILCAGFPCQAFSFAGKRLGFKDTRGTLFFDIARVARQKRPSILFLENVRGLLSHDEGRTFGTILHTLYELGYDVEWQVINGRYFLPQNRERVFIVGHLRERPTKQVFPLGTYAGMAEEVNAKGGEQPVNCIDASYAKGPDKHGQRTMIASGTWKSRGFELRKDNLSHCLRAGDGSGARTFVMLGHTMDTSGSKLAVEDQGKIR